MNEIIKRNKGSFSFCYIVFKTMEEESSQRVGSFSNNETERFTFFFSEKDPLSNFYPARFTVDFKQFNCTEQYFHYMKAIKFNDLKTAELILKADSPRKQKFLGRKVKNYDETLWNVICVQVMKDGNLAKFKQNKNLEHILLGTVGTILVEASPFDRKWGIGLAKTNPNVFDRSKWKGDNLLGKVLTEVRDQIISEN